MTIDALTAHVPDLAADALLANCLEGWAARYGEIPAEYLPAVTTYITEGIGAIPDLFDQLDGQSLRQLAADVSAEGASPAAVVDQYVRAHLAYLDQWFTALDTLDSELRDGRGRLPDWAEPVTRGIALEIFAADTALKSAVIDYHHGSAGQRLSPAHGYAYSLSNGTAAPFGP